MRKFTLALLALVLLAGAFAAGIATQRTRSGSASTRKVLYWVDPMHPAYRSDGPGIAPDCGMQLEPVYADGAPSPGPGAAPRPAGAVQIALDKRQLLGVRVAPVVREAITHTLRLFGRVAADETRVYSLNSALEGSIREVSAVTTGSRVRKGQWLASFFSYDSRSPMQAYITALDVEERTPASRRQVGAELVAGTTSSTNVQFSVERLRGLGMSQEQIDEIRRKREIPLTIGIHAPADGFVVARNVSPGQKFERGAEWYRIVNLDRVWILADVFENEGSYLKPGLQARVAVPGQARTFTARVSEILPQFDASTRTLKVRLLADNPGWTLRPDMFVDVTFPVELPPALTIPVDALMDSGLRRTVFVERGDGHFEPRAVETGWRSGERVEVLRGLAPGERIVVSGTFLVDSESRLRAAAAGVYGEPARDPVCGMEVDESRARAAGKTHEHGGRTYFFCSDQCRSKFTEGPERYLEATAATGRGSTAGRP